MQKATNDPKAGDRTVLTINGVEFPFRWCPPGTFMMGSPSSEAERLDDETQHQVTLSHGFWMLETPVTQSMWEKVTGSNPSHFKGANLPVETVSWEDCQQFIDQLNAHLAGTPGVDYRFSFPTEAQWEYACRAGTTTPFHFGRVLNSDKANCKGSYPYRDSTQGRGLGETSDVGSYPANAWGLFDMHGNVWEWCSDWYDDNPDGSVTDPMGPSGDSCRVLRGGSWSDDANLCRSAARDYVALSYQFNFIGVRLALVRVE